MMTKAKQKNRFEEDDLEIYLPNGEKWKESPSRINKYATCPGRIDYGYYQEIPKTASIAGATKANKGKILHTNFANFFVLIQKNEIFDFFYRGKLEHYFLRVLASNTAFFYKFRINFVNFARFETIRFIKLFQFFDKKLEDKLEVQNETWKYFRPIARELWCETQLSVNFRARFDRLDVIPAGFKNNEVDELALGDYKTGNPKGSWKKNSKGKRYVVFDNDHKRQLMSTIMYWGKYRIPDKIVKVQNYFPKIRYYYNMYTGFKKDYPNGNVTWGELAYNKDGWARSFTYVRSWQIKMRNDVQTGVFECKPSKFNCIFCDSDKPCVRKRKVKNWRLIENAENG